MRGVWTKRAGLPRPLCNTPVFTLDGLHVGTPDLISPELGLLGLYNGSDHLTLVGASADQKQESAYRDLGLEVVTMLATDWADLDDFTARLRAGCPTRPIARWALDRRPTPFVDAHQHRGAAARRCQIATGAATSAIARLRDPRRTPG